MLCLIGLAVLRQNYPSIHHLMPETPLPLSSMLHRSWDRDRTATTRSIEFGSGQAYSLMNLSYGSIAFEYSNGLDAGYQRRPSAIYVNSDGEKVRNG